MNDRVVHVCHAAFVRRYHDRKQGEGSLKVEKFKLKVVHRRYQVLEEIPWGLWRWWVSSGSPRYHSTFHSSWLHLRYPKGHSSFNLKIYSDYLRQKWVVNVVSPHCEYSCHNISDMARRYFLWYLFISVINTIYTLIEYKRVSKIRCRVSEVANRKNFNIPEIMVVREGSNASFGTFNYFNLKFTLGQKAPTALHADIFKGIGILSWEILQVTYASYLYQIAAA